MHFPKSGENFSLSRFFRDRSSRKIYIRTDFLIGNTIPPLDVNLFFSVTHDEWLFSCLLWEMEDRNGIQSITGTLGIKGFRPWEGPPPRKMKQSISPPGSPYKVRGMRSRCATVRAEIPELSARENRLRMKALYQVFSFTRSNARAPSASSK